MVELSALAALTCLRSLYEEKKRCEHFASSDTAEGLYEEHVIQLEKAIHELGPAYEKERQRYDNLPSWSEVESQSG